MKTHLSRQFLLLFSFVSMLLLSCSKNDDTKTTPVVPQVNQPSLNPIGNIVDSGAVNPGLRVMKMNLVTQNFILYSSNDEVLYSPAKVNVAFYVNDDGLIPSGEYNFTNSDVKAPFTFDSGVLFYSNANDPNNTKSDAILDGSITVHQDGKNYVFSLQISLASGLTATQILSGPLGYADSK